MQGQHSKVPMTAALSLPPEKLRVTVGPFSDAGLFARSGDDMWPRSWRCAVSRLMRASWRSAAVAAEAALVDGSSHDDVIMGILDREFAGA